MTTATLNKTEQRILARLDKLESGSMWTDDMGVREIRAVNSLIGKGVLVVTEKQRDLYWRRRGQGRMSYSQPLYITTRRIRRADAA